MSRTVRVGIVIGLIVAMAAALAVVLMQDSGNSDVPAAAPTASASPTTEPASSPPASPTPSAQPVAVPTPDLTGDDYERIFREIVTFRDWLYEHPHPQATDLIYHPACDCHEELVTALEGLIEDDVHFDDDGWRVEQIERAELEDERLLRIVATLRRTPQRVVNDAGDVLQSGEGVPATRYSFLLMGGEDEGWRVRTIHRLEES